MELRDGETGMPVPPPMPRALLGMLALRPGSPVLVDEIIDGLWGDAPPESARNVVQVYVSSLRRMLGRDAIGSGPGGYGLDAAVWVDAVEFEHELRAGLRMAGDPTVVADTLGRTLGLWRGEPLADVAAPFAEAQRTRLTELRLSAVEAWADAGLACGRQDELVSELEAWIGRYPLRELLWAQLITALDRGGRQADALATYHRVRAVLRDELGADPGEQVQRAHRDVLAPPRTAAARLPPGAAVPAPHSDLIGRENDISGIRALLGRPGVRLVTVLGPAGPRRSRRPARGLHPRPAVRRSRRPGPHHGGTPARQLAPSRGQPHSAPRGPSHRSASPAGDTDSSRNRYPRPGPGRGSRRRAGLTLLIIREGILDCQHRRA